MNPHLSSTKQLCADSCRIQIRRAHARLGSTCRRLAIGRSFAVHLARRRHSISSCGRQRALMITAAPSSRLPTLRILWHRLQQLQCRLRDGSRRRCSAVRALASSEELPRIVYAVSAAAGHDAPGMTSRDPTPLLLCLLDAHLQSWSGSRACGVRCSHTCNYIRPRRRGIDIGSTARAGAL